MMRVVRIILVVLVAISLTGDTSMDAVVVINIESIGVLTDVNGNNMIIQLNQNKEAS